MTSIAFGSLVHHWLATYGVERITGLIGLFSHWHPLLRALAVGAFQSQNPKRELKSKRLFYSAMLRAT